MAAFKKRKKAHGLLSLTRCRKTEEEGIKRRNREEIGRLTLRAAIGEEAVTIEDVYEPYLMQIGFLSRTPRGRCVTAEAYRHLGYTVPANTTPAQGSLFE